MVHLQHMEVPRLRVELELQLPAYTTATATQDPSHICDLCYSLQQRCIFNPLSQARDQTLILMDTNWVLKDFITKSHIIKEDKKKIDEISC